MARFLKNDSKHQEPAQTPSKKTASSHFSLQESTAETNSVIDTTNPDVTISQPAKSSWSQLFSFTRRSHVSLLTAAVLSAGLTAAFKSALAVVLGRVFDVVADYDLGKVGSESTMSTISRWCLIFFGIGVGNWMANSAFLALWIAFGELQASTVRSETFRSLLSKDISWFDSQAEGISSLLVRIQIQTRELQLATSQIFGLLVCDFLTAIASLGIAFYFSWKLTLVLLASLPVSAIILSLVTRKLEPAIQAQRQQLATASKHATASITAIDLVKIFNGHEQELWHYYTGIQKAAKHYLVQALINSFQMGWVAFWVIAMFVIGFWYGIVLVEEGLSPGSVLTTFYATLSSFQGIEALMPHWLVIAKGMSAGAFLKAVNSDSDSGKKHVRQMGRSVCPKTCSGDIELSNVSFAYPINPTTLVLNQSSMFFPAGEMTFIVGRSGSGKSTIGSLVANFYEPLTGDVQVDGQSMRVLDKHWIRQNITLIQQSSILFNETFFRNVAFGHPSPDNVTRDEVLAACDRAMLQTTVATLPEGLNTNVGSEGHNLSGGQKQRVALARAYLRDPPVLILDEVTSGLDQVSRLMVMEAIRTWRHNKTTIIITHDVSQIEDKDFVYVMDSSYLVQEGFKQDLLKAEGGHFASLASLETQSEVDGHDESGGPQINIIAPDSPTASSPSTPVMASRSARFSQSFFDGLDTNTLQVGNPEQPKRFSLGGGMDYALNLGLSRMWDSSAVPTRQPSYRAETTQSMEEEKKNFSKYINQRFLLSDGAEGSANSPRSRPLSWRPLSRRLSTMTSEGPRADVPIILRSNPRYVNRATSACMPPNLVVAPAPACMEHISLQDLSRSGIDHQDIQDDSSFSTPSKRRRQRLVPATKGISEEDEYPSELAMRNNSEDEENLTLSNKAPKKQKSLFWTLKTVWPNLSLTDRLTMLLGIAAGIVGACSTPVFSYAFAQLLGVMTSPGDKMVRGMKWAGIMLAVAVTDGLGCGTCRYLLERAGQSWVNTVRIRALRRILLQPKEWFAKGKNSPGRINECLDRNAEEMRNIVGKFIPITLAVTVMISISIVWSLVVSWKLTLVSLSPLPVVGASVKGFAMVSSKWEAKCNKGAEEASATATETFLNIRVVRALTLDTYFRTKYENMVADTFGTGLKRAAATCCLYGLFQSSGYALTALLFYYGSILMVEKEELSVAEVMQVLNLLLFSIGSATGLLSTIPQLTMAQATATQMLAYASMPTQPPEGQQGDAKLRIILPVRMSGLEFSYSKRPDEKVLNGVSLHVEAGKCTAIVGHSGCGKSTIISLLMGLYVPRNPSSLSYGGISSSEIDIEHLRSMMAYVPQQAFLFPASIADNIAYGLSDDSPCRETNAICRAANDADLHDWIVSLPEGYNTRVGDGGQALSGGQAQRLCIARALVRRPKLLVLDEPTSALDTESADMIRQTIRELSSSSSAGEGAMAIVLVTHSREMMRAADWIVMMGEGGVVVEEGVYAKLWARRGEFAHLVSGGEVDGT